MTGPAGAAGQAVTPDAQVAAAGDKMPLSVWLRQQREDRGWSRREQARRLIQAGRDAGDTAMPSVDDMTKNTRRWERGDNEPTERYKLYYCKTFEIPVTEFGVTAPGTDALSPIATVNAHGLSVSLGYVAGRLVIEISGLDTGDAEPKPGPGLSLVTSPDPAQAARRTGMNTQIQPVPVTGAEHPLRRVRLRRGLTQVELAGLAGLSYAYISMIECGRRKLTRRDHVNALAAALRVAPAGIAPAVVPGSDEWAPAPPAPASAFPLVSDDIAAARHRELAGQLIGHVIQGDMYAAGAWLRRLARDPSVNPWLLLDQLTAPALVLPGPRSRPLGGSVARLVSADSTGRGRAT